MYICPNDLMKYDADLGKAFNKDHGMAFNQEPDACWECFSCVKACPQGAIVMRGYADVVPLGG
jgi:adenylylsulfate reductase subunit B